MDAYMYEKSEKQNYKDFKIHKVFLKGILFAIQNFRKSIFLKALL